MRLYSFPFDKGLPQELFSAFCNQPYSLFLDSADPVHELSRYSFLVFHPLESIESKDGLVTVTNREQQFTFEGDAFEVLKERLDIYGLETQTRHDLPPFQGGAAGYFGYDLARGLEKLPNKNISENDTPDMAVGIYDQVYAYDHKKNMGIFLIHAMDEASAQARFEYFVKCSEDRRDEADIIPAPVSWQSSHTQEEYEAAVQKTIDYIYAGDIFQANLSQRFEADLPQDFDSWSHYLNLREVNAAPFAAYLNLGSVKIASSSPERFLFADHREVETRPIKGTARRQPEEALDQLYRNSLENSDKDRAENTMIVDLLRNDLSKICEDHSVEVTQLCKLETFKKVHHLVSIVKGLLRADKSPVDLLKACFPGGSITGAPKVRAMEIIEELEQKRRGPYCGAIGYIGFNGTMDTNIVIRTLVYEGNKVSFNAGGGIVADSVPEDEYNETLAKAEAIFASFDDEAAFPAEEEIVA